MPESDVAQYIRQIVEETRDRKMLWLKTNPTTYVWRKVDGAIVVAQLSIQKILKRRPVPAGPGRVSLTTEETFVFQATELPSGSIRLSLSSEKQPEIQGVLKELFDTISANIEREGLDFLKEVIS
jgi:hypothetical protein